MNNPAATKESITVDGWFKTGDFCTCDAEGFYFFEYRTKDLIKYKVFPILSHLSFNSSSLWVLIFFTQDYQGITVCLEETDRLTLLLYFISFSSKDRRSVNATPQNQGCSCHWVVF